MVGNMGSKGRMVISFSNCAEMHSRDLENGVGMKDLAKQGDDPHFHFSGVNDGGY